MQRRGQPRTVHLAPLAIRRRKYQAIVKFDFSTGARAFVKIGQIRAAAQRDVLAIVHLAAIGQCVGGGSPAQVRTFFQQPYAEARFSQRDGGRQARQSAADY